MNRSFRLALLVCGMASVCILTLRATPPLQSQNPSAQPAGTSGPANGNPSSSAPAMGDMQGMSPSAMPENPGTPPWCQDNTWSVANHRVSGWFLIVWGLAAFVAGMEWPRRTWRRYVGPMVLFGLAEFLFFRNDPEAWPTGPMSFWASLHDPEDLQHHVFLLLIILMALVELLRAADRLSLFAAKYALPALGAFGAVYLFFHKHGGTAMAQMMNSSAQEPGSSASSSMQQMMASMSVVRHEHLWFSIIGFGFVVAKLLGDTGHLKGRWGTALWPVFAVLLGTYMLSYVE